MNLERLHILYDHLMYGKLGHKKFDFNLFNNAGDVCGTSGCAIGECPIVWPNDWKFTESGRAIIRNELYGFNSAEKWFELTSDETLHLFEPEDQNTDKYGGKCLGPTATRQQVAKNIKAFINKMEDKNEEV